MRLLIALSLFLAFMLNMTDAPAQDPAAVTVTADASETAVIARYLAHLLNDPDEDVEARRTTSKSQTDACCIFCEKSKPCGDICISRFGECTKPPGCACDSKSALGPRLTPPDALP